MPSSTGSRRPSRMAPPPVPWALAKRLQAFDVSSAGQPRRLPWTMLRQAGGVFAVVRLMENLTADRMAMTHCNDALASGFDLWSYSFFHSDGDAEDQADAVSNLIIASRVKFRGRHAMDWEDANRVDPRKGGVGPIVALRNGLAYLRAITKNLGRRPIVYTYPGFMAYFHSVFSDPRFAKEVAELASYDLWVSHFRWDPVTGHDYEIVEPLIPVPFKEARAWQVRGNKGPPILGVDTPLDRSVFFGDQDDYEQWCDDKPYHERGLIRGDQTPDAPASTLDDEAHRIAQDKKSE